MSTNTTSSNQSCSTEYQSIEEAIDSFVEAVDVPKSAASPFMELVEGMARQVEQLEEELRSTKKEAAEDRKRIHELEERLDEQEAADSDDANPTPDVEDDASTDTQTPLEQVATLPDEAALSQLSANQRRARFVAKDVEQYASKVPAGYAITSGEISTVLRAGTDSSGRTQTVARVMDFLDRLGGGMVKVVKRRGTKRVIFDEGLVQKLSQIETESEPNNGRRYPTTGVGV